MESLQPAQPVLSYAHEEAAGGTIIWREETPGTHVFIVPPPPLLRLIILPAIGMFVITPVAALVILFAIMVVKAESGLAPRLGTSLVAFLFGVTWFLAIKRLVHVARHGRKAFMLRISPEGFSAVSPYRKDDCPLQTRPAVNVNLECLPGEFPVRMVLLRILFTESEYDAMTFSYTPTTDRVLFHIPWPDRLPLRPWEERLFNALVCRTRSDTSTEDTAPCVN